MPKQFTRAKASIGNCSSCGDKQVKLVLHGRLDFIADDGEPRYHYEKVCEPCADGIEIDARNAANDAIAKGFAPSDDYSDLF